MKKHSPFICVRVGGHGVECADVVRRTKARKLKAKRAENQSRRANRS